MLFVRKAADVELPDYGYRVESLGIGDDLRSASRESWEWLRRERPDAVIFAGAAAAEAAVRHLDASIRSVIAVHDATWSLCRNAVRLEKHADAIVTVSDYVARQFRAKLQSPEKLHVIHNAVEVVDVTGPETRPDDLYFSGGMQPLKGPDDVLKLWPVLIDRGFDGTLHWLGRLDESWERRIATLPESRRIELVGRLSIEDVWGMASRCKVMLMLSRSESFSMALAEASCAGCLTVGWDIDSGHRELANLLELPYLAKFGDFDELADQVARAIGDFGEKSDLQAARAREVFDPNAVWRRYQSVLEAAQAAAPAVRDRVETPPPPYRRPDGYYQILPGFVRRRVTRMVFRSRWLSMLLRNRRGF